MNVEESKETSVNQVSKAKEEEEQSHSGGGDFKGAWQWPSCQREG